MLKKVNVRVYVLLCCNVAMLGSFTYFRLAGNSLPLIGVVVYVSYAFASVLRWALLYEELHPESFVEESLN